MVSNNDAVLCEIDPNLDDELFAKQLRRNVKVNVMATSLTKRQDQIDAPMLAKRWKIGLNVAK